MTTHKNRLFRDGLVLNVKYYKITTQSNLERKVIPASLHILLYIFDVSRVPYLKKSFFRVSKFEGGRLVHFCL